MRELQAFVSSCGYSTEINADGNLHRFKTDSKDHKESGWYIFFQNHSTKTGEPYYVGMIGSWRTGDEYSYQSQKPIGKEDKDLIRKKIEAAQRKINAEKARLQEEAKKRVKEKFESITEGLSEYHKKKGLEKPYGARIKSDLRGITTYIPMVDVNGELWNVQRIFPDGQKRFEAGGRVKGCFHQIGSGGDTVYVCEGFATAASIHEATGGTVIAAFSANNLVDCVRELKARFPEKAFVICGDEDEAGRAKAEEAAKISLGKSVYPIFKIKVEKRTDFNDLAEMEGLSRVREIILEIKPEKRYVIALGYHKDSYYFVSSINQQIQKITASSLSSSGLMRLQPLEYWEVLYPGKKSPVDWTKASSDLIEACHRKGVFRPEKIRGRGVWIDEEKIIYHRGDSLHINGLDHGLHDLKTKYTYDQDEEMPRVHSLPLTLEETQRLQEVSTLIRFKRETDPALFMGFLVIAPICGAIHWRPHVWLTGQSGTGKSYILNEIVKPLLQGMSHFFSGQTTEAGLRQKTGVSSLPVLFDEFETNDENSAQRVLQILELARQACSDSEAVVAKGSSSGEAMEFRPRFSMMVSSVRSNLKHEEDKNRFTMLDIVRNEDGDQADQFEKLKKAVLEIQGDFGVRLFSRTLKMLPVIRASQVTLQRTFGAKYTMRVGQQMSALISGYWSLVSDDPIDEKSAQNFADQLEVSDETSITHDEKECLDHLLQTILTVDSDTATVRLSVLEMVNDEYRYRDALSRYGLSADKTHLYIAFGHTQIKTIYSKTKWSGGFAKSLMRITGASKTQKRIGQSVKVIKVQIPT